MPLLFRINMNSVAVSTDMVAIKINKPSATEEILIGQTSW